MPQPTPRSLALLITASANSYSRALNRTNIVAEIDDVQCNLIPPILPYQIITTNGTYYFVAVFFACSTHAVKIPYAIADVAVTNMTVDRTIVGRGYTVQVNETVANLGSYEQTFSVTAYANTTSINETQVTLTNGNNAKIDVAWNTTAFAYGNYDISAYAWPVSFETNMTNNNGTAGMVYVGIPGDVNGDCTVNILDAIKLGNAFLATPGSSNWNASADINGDSAVNILDAIILSNNFLQHYP